MYTYTHMCIHTCVYGGPPGGVTLVCYVRYYATLRRYVCYCYMISS